ncbi:SgcJ/EcaC family oxidoreductase [bacterium]|nr:SgcJ/EcaC family oxidoreductase [bacterium]
MARKGAKKIAEENFKRWNEALRTKNSRKVAELYSAKNAFLPTLSGDFKKGLSGAEEYFKHFLQKGPVSRVVKSEAQISEDGKTLIYSGMYDFKMGKNGNREIIRARFTFVWQKNKNGEWKIIHHHSSLKPK